eukprot:41047-Chlamydomonas_euryale.AAC.1
MERMWATRSVCISGTADGQLTACCRDSVGLKPDARACLAPWHCRCGCTTLTAVPTRCASRTRCRTSRQAAAWWSSTARHSASRKCGGEWVAVMCGMRQKGPGRDQDIPKLRLLVDGTPLSAHQGTTL